MPPQQNSVWAGVPYSLDVMRPDDTPPTLPTVSMPQQSPFASAPPMPNVTQEPSALKPIADTAKARYAKDVWADNNPWGTANNHPGTMGKIAHVLSVAGNIAGNIFAPAVMANIPGTQLNRKEDEGQQRGIIDQTAKDQAGLDETAQNVASSKMKMAMEPEQEVDRHNLSQSQGGHLDAETYALQHPKPEYEYQQTDHGLMAIDKRTGQAQAVTLNGTPLGPKQELKYETVLGADNKPHTYGLDAQGNKAADVGVHYEKPNVTNINQGTWALEENPSTGKPVLFNSKTGQTRDAPDIAKSGTHAKAMAPYQAIVEEAQMAHQLADAATKGNAPADVDLALSFFKTMKGTGSGIRFTQAEQDLIRGARSAGADMQGVAQKVLGGGQMFTPEQRANIVKVIDMHAQAAQAHMQGGGEAPAGGTVRARDPQGKLHEAPAGTPLPAGWKPE